MFAKENVRLLIRHENRFRIRDTNIKKSTGKIRLRGKPARFNFRGQFIEGWTI